MRFALIIVILLVMSACSQPANPYEENMRMGKDALISGNYEEAYRYFEISLIERPQDSDAKILIEQAKSHIDENEMLKHIKEYWVDIDPLLQKYKGMAEKYRKYDKLDLTHQNKTNLAYINGISNDLKSVEEKYDEISGIIKLHEKLKSSISTLINYLEKDGVLVREVLKDAAIQELDDYNTELMKMIR
ncbi:hypothetical protein B1748_23745 [Paenibacillus sp. MY03]|uniref:hypothetical protein n=1 Tax=Paenibacillus sp. MY03 TaxID=302980 RepID=UPI000B3C7595|nr:hypothetical protein [Paenibacillus sp. MY03]OUS73023.1 hypothetical protein B1748_23745 [Paenibacillus sp. MY03]